MDRSDPESEVDRLLAKLRKEISPSLLPVVSDLERQISRISTGAYALGTWASSPATNLQWKQYGLSRYEIRLMEALQKAGPSGLSKDRLMTVLYAAEVDDWPADKIIDIRLCYIRKKLEACNAPWWIETVYGQGWILHEGHKTARKTLTGRKSWVEITGLSSRLHGRHNTGVE